MFGGKTTIDRKNVNFVLFETVLIFGAGFKYTGSLITILQKFTDKPLEGTLPKKLPEFPHVFSEHPVHYWVLCRSTNFEK